MCFQIVKIVTVSLYCVLLFKFLGVCRRAMGSLLDILQGHQPEELSREPTSVVDPMFDILLELASESESSSSDQVYLWIFCKPLSVHYNIKSVSFRNSSVQTVFCLNMYKLSTYKSFVTSVFQVQHRRRPIHPSLIRRLPSQSCRGLR